MGSPRFAIIMWLIAGTAPLPERLIAEESSPSAAIGTGRNQSAETNGPDHERAAGGEKQADSVGQAAAPGTLFRWSSATDKAGGPNLDEVLATDRPDFTEASSTVGRGVVQIESGYTYSVLSTGVKFATHSDLWDAG